MATFRRDELKDIAILKEIILADCVESDDIIDKAYMQHVAEFGIQKPLRYNIKFQYSLVDGCNCYDAFLMVKQCCCAEGSGDSYLDALQDLWVSMQGDWDCHHRERQRRPSPDFRAELELANPEDEDGQEEDNEEEDEEVVAAEESQLKQGISDETARKVRARWFWWF